MLRLINDNYRQFYKLLSKAGLSSQEYKRLEELAYRLDENEKKGVVNHEYTNKCCV